MFLHDTHELTKRNRDIQLNYVYYTILNFNIISNTHQTKQLALKISI